MSKLKIAREKLNLTQEELATQSGVSVRTIQRIEAGTDPKGYTLKVLAKTLAVNPEELVNVPETKETINYTLIKLINFSSVPVFFLPPFNIIFPLIIMFLKKEFSTVAKQIVTIQILWTILSFILFMLFAFIKNWYSLGNKFTLIVMVLLALSNITIVLLNAAGIDKNKKLTVRLKFSLM